MSNNCQDLLYITYEMSLWCTWCPCGVSRCVRKEIRYYQK